MQRRTCLTHLTHLTGLAALAASRSTLVAGSAALLGGPALAQSGPMRLVVPYPAGGPLDIVARALAAKVHDTLGQVIIENKPGAGGNIGADLVAKAAPDGRTIVLGAVATHAINRWLYSKLPYDPQHDFEPITLVARVPNVLVLETAAADRMGINSVADLIAYAKRNPGELNYGSGGNGSAGHLAGELLRSQAGLKFTHIPFAGAAPAQLALLSGQVQFNFDNLASAAVNIRAGKLKPLAVTGARRSVAMPELPTMAESGLPGFAIDTWFGLFAPAKTPAATIDKLNAAYLDALKSAELRVVLTNLMAESQGGTPAQLADLVTSELAKYKVLVASSGAKAD